MKCYFWMKYQVEYTSVSRSCMTFSSSRCRIMGLYVSVVLVIGKFVRGFFSEISHSIMFEELPCVDRILKLCTDIFLVSVYRTHPHTNTHT